MNIVSEEVDVLPEELIVKIFKLTAYDDLFNCRLVSCIYYQNFSIDFICKLQCEITHAISILLCDSLNDQQWYLSEYIMKNYANKINHELLLSEYTANSRASKGLMCLNQSLVNIFGINEMVKSAINIVYEKYALFCSIINEETPICVFLKYFSLIDITDNIKVDYLALNANDFEKCLFCEAFFGFFLKKSDEYVLKFDRYHKLLTNFNNFKILPEHSILRCLLILKNMLEFDPEYAEFMGCEEIPQPEDKEKIITMIKHLLKDGKSTVQIHDIMLKFKRKYSINFGITITELYASTIADEARMFFSEYLGDLYVD